jgi:hypothetical protein
MTDIQIKKKVMYTIVREVRAMRRIAKTKLIKTASKLREASMTGII